MDNLPNAEMTIPAVKNNDVSFKTLKVRKENKWLTQNPNYMVLGHA